MARELSKGEIKALQDLEDNFYDYLREYKETRENDYQNGKHDELNKELKDLEDYYNGCINSEIDDLRVNISYCGAKIEVLKGILSNK